MPGTIVSERFIHYLTILTDLTAKHVNIIVKGDAGEVVIFFEIAELLAIRFPLPRFAASVVFQSLRVAVADFTSSKYDCHCRITALPLGDPTLLVFVFVNLCLCPSRFAIPQHTVIPIAHRRA